MRVRVSHTTRLDYDTDVFEAVMDARLGPHSDADQHWGRFELRVSPSASTHRYADGFGNTAHLITIARPHQFVEVVALGEVDTLLVDPFASPVVPPRPLTEAERVDYLMSSNQVELSPVLEAMAAPFRPSDPAETFDAVRGLMELVYRRFTYEPEVTTVTTTIPEILAARAGVCQDFAHLLAGLCRSIGLPARYVSGYIVQTEHWQQRAWDVSSKRSDEAIADETPLRGARASHAWTEVHTPTHGWRGFDPTNNLVANACHIKMAVGRDYTDIPPTRGTFRGDAEERLTVSVATGVTDTA